MTFICLYIKNLNAQSQEKFTDRDVMKLISSQVTRKNDSVDLILNQWKQQKPDMDVSPMGIIGRISRMERLLDVRLSATFRTFGLERWSFDVLAALRRSGKPYRLTPSKLFKSLMITSGAMTHRIDCLEKAGLVERHEDPTDRRGTLVGLTPKGEALIDRAVVAHVRNEADMIETLETREREQLANLLRKLLRGLEC